MTIPGVVIAVMLQSALQQAPARDIRPPMAAAVTTAAISGVVVSDGAEPRPLRRARVSLNGHALDIGRTVITADDGTFVFTGLPAGAYTLSAAKEAYVAMSYGAAATGRQGLPVAVQAGETARVTLRLPRGAVITGTVLDVDGSPAQGITVSALERRFYGTGEYRYVPAGAPTLPTDDRGVYRIYGLPAGEYVVAAQPEQGVGVGQPPSASIRPMVRGTPAARAVSATQVFYPSVVDSAAATRIRVAAGEERGGIDLQLQYVPLATISGSVVLAGDWNGPAIAVSPAGSELGPGWIRAARPDASGAFTVSPLPPGQYQVLARTVDRQGHMMAATVFVTLDGEDVQVTLTPQPAPAVSGLTVFRGDTPPPMFGTERADSSMLPYRPVDYAPPMQVDGVRFRIQGMGAGRHYLGANLMGVRTPRAGTWWLQSLTAGGVELLDAPLDLRQNIDDAIAVFSDRASELTGVVADARGKPFPDATVVAFSADRAAWFFLSRRVAGAAAGANGRYVIRNLPPGDYRVAVATDLAPNEWFDPSVLDRLLPGAAPVPIDASGTKVLDLTIR